MSALTPLRIAIVSACYSEGMGYSENGLSRALARLGHEVHVVTSTFNVYGNEPMYDETYRDFLGPRQVAPGAQRIDGYTVHRLPGGTLFGYVHMQRLLASIRHLRPDVVHSLSVASLQTFSLALQRATATYRLFCDNHHHLSVMRPYMLQRRGALAKRAAYRLTRTLPAALAARMIDRVYAIAPDCGEVARRFYGVPASKISYLPLGTDTELFHPAATTEEWAARAELRRELGCTPDDVLCVYTGRFTSAKNPLLLAQAVDQLVANGVQVRVLFIGDGPQRDALASGPHTVVRSFMKHTDLAAHYRAADLAVWPREESMSMLDAAASGLPLVVSHGMGENERVRGNGRTYQEQDVDDLARTIMSLANPDERAQLAMAGRDKMERQFSWMQIARQVERDYRMVSHIQ